MSFLAPKILYWLLALPVLAGFKAWADWRARKVQAAFAAPRLRDALVSGVSSGRSWLIFVFQVLALACFIIALARPWWDEDKVVQQESGRNVIIAIDSSRSMLANDVVPDRLTRAKLAAQDLMLSLKDDRVGLIAFAGNAYLQAPLTTDHDAVVEAIQSIDFTSVPRGGSELGRALKLAIETFEKSPARNHGLILFSDGGEPDSEISAYAQQAARKNILVLTVGVGTEGGALIPDPDPDRSGDFVRDREGNVVKTRLEPQPLQEIAAVTRGRYLRLGSQGLAADVVRSLVASLQAQTNAAREIVKPIERFYWPLSIGVLLLFAAWIIRPAARMKTPVTPPVFALLASLLLVPDVDAADPGFLGSVLGSKKNAESVEAHEAYKRGEFDHAAKRYEELLKQSPGVRQKPLFAYGMAASAFQLKDYDRAVAGYSQALESPDSKVQNQAHRGLAHSLYDQGDKALPKQPKFTLKAWRDSVRHFDASLAIDPGNKEVRENRDFVQKRLDELQQQMNQQQQQGGKGNKGEKKKGQKGQKGEKGQKGQEGDEQEGDNGDEEGEGEGEDDKSRKESLGKKDGEEEGEGEGKEHDKEGQLQAGEGGRDETPEARAARERREAEMAENQQNEATGFSRNEARSFLRTYADDQKKAMIVRPRDEPVRGKDW